jgi:hypothetical protein
MHAPSLPNGSCHPCLQVHYSMAEIPGSLFVPIEDQSHSPFATEGESGHPLGLRSASGPCFPASPEVQPFVAPATKGCIQIRLHLSALGGERLECTRSAGGNRHCCRFRLPHRFARALREALSQLGRWILWIGESVWSGGLAPGRGIPGAPEGNEAAIRKRNTPVG